MKLFFIQFLETSAANVGDINEIAPIVELVFDVFVIEEVVVVPMTAKVIQTGTKDADIYFSNGPPATPPRSKEPKDLFSKSW